MILIIRSNGITKDPRVNKYLSYLESNHIDYKVIGWDRNEEGLESKKHIYFRKKSGYSVGGLKAAWNRILWMLFCFKQISKIKPSFIHGCDLDSVFPAVMYKISHKKKTKVLFDIFDWFSATLYNQPKIITSAFKFMEKLSTKYSDQIIICEQERIRQIPYDVTSKVHVFSNIPMIHDDREFKYPDESLTFPNDNITVSYVGGLYSGRFIDDLLDIAEEGKINLLIAGYGDPRLEDRCKKLSEKENVKYFGAVPYEKGLHISYNSDIMFAMYCKSNPNHIFAAPNKYYEAMLLEKPLLTTQGTMVGDKVIKNSIGFVIEEDIEELSNLLEQCNLKKSMCVEKGKRAGLLWQTNYSSATQKFLSTTYQQMIQS